VALSRGQLGGFYQHMLNVPLSDLAFKRHASYDADAHGRSEELLRLTKPGTLTIAENRNAGWHRSRRIHFAGQRSAENIRHCERGDLPPGKCPNSPSFVVPKGRFVVDRDRGDDEGNRPEWSQ
jgi:hypothetical protein